MNEQIKQYTKYSLNCILKPCSKKGCSLNNDIPTIIKLVREDNIKEAFMELKKTRVLGSICGRICRHMKQ